MATKAMNMSDTSLFTICMHEVHVTEKVPEFQSVMGTSTGEGFLKKWKSNEALKLISVVCQTVTNQKLLGERHNI